MSFAGVLFFIAIIAFRANKRTPCVQALPKRSDARKIPRSYLNQVKRQLSAEAVKGWRKGGKQRREEEAAENEDRPPLAAPRRGRELQLAGTAQAPPAGRTKPAARARQPMGGARPVIARVSQAPGCTHKAGFERPPFSHLPAAAAPAFPGRPRAARASPSAVPAVQVGKVGGPRRGSNGATLSPGPSGCFPHGGRCGSRRRLPC